MKNKTIAGFNVSCVGDDRTYSYVPSRNGKTISDLIAKHVLKWIDKNFGDISQVPMNSTAEAAKFVSNNDNCVAIVSDLAIEKYQLHCLARSIQDFQDNQTRFLVIGNFEPETAKKNKSSFLIRTENKPGALLEILKPFNEYNINLFRIETRPSRSDRGSHDFFIDSEGHVDEKEMQLVIKKVKDVSSFVKVLGSYPMHS